MAVMGLEGAALGLDLLSIHTCSCRFDDEGSYVDALIPSWPDTEGDSRRVAERWVNNCFNL